MFVVDTNILIYAAHRRSPFHARAYACLREWMAMPEPWFATWGILYEFMRVTTHRSVFAEPWAATASAGFVRSLLHSPGFRLLDHTPNHPAVLDEVVAECPSLAGNAIHDLHIAVLMREHGIREIRTRDVHFHRFPFLKVVDPLQ